MLINWDRKKKIKFILCEVFLLIIMFFLGVSLVNAQNSNDILISYSLTTNCELTVNFPYNLAEDWQNAWSTPNAGAIIAQYGGQHPATTTFQGSKTGFTNDLIGDWVSEWKQEANNNNDGTINGNSVTWANLSDQFYSGSVYWYWAFPDASYYAQFFINPDDTCEPVNATDFGDISPLDFNTRFTDATATGTSSTTISVDVDYILDINEYTANNRPDAISIITLSNGFFNDQQVSNDRRLILPLTNGAQSKNIPLEYLPDNGGFPDGDYISYINFYNINTDNVTFNQANIILSFEISAGAIVSTNVDFISDGQNISTNFDYQECSITNLYGCLVNAFIFTFVPDENALDKFTGAWQQIEQKPPFGYVTSLIDALENNAVTTPAFDFGNIPFISTIFDPLKILFSIGLWFIYALFFLGRMDKLDI